MTTEEPTPKQIADELLDRVLHLLNHDIRVAPGSLLHEDIKAYMEKQITQEQTI